MPPAPPPPGAKAKGGNILTKKFGPFSGWVWLVMVGGSVALFFMMRRGGTPSTFETVTGNEGPPDGAGAGAPPGNAPPGSQLDPEVLAQLQGISAEVSNISRAFGTATGAWEDAAGQTVSQLDQIRQSIEDAQYKQYNDNGLGMDPAGMTIASTLGAPGKKPGRKNDIMWGGTIYGRGMGEMFIREQLRPKGVNPQTFAKRHPAFASYLGIPKDAPKKKAGPARPAPRAQPQRPGRVQASPRARAKVQPKAKLKTRRPRRAAGKKK